MKKRLSKKLLQKTKTPENIKSLSRKKSKKTVGNMMFPFMQTLSTNKYAETPKIKLVPKIPKVSNNIVKKIKEPSKIESFLMSGLSPSNKKQEIKKSFSSIQYQGLFASVLTPQQVFDQAKRSIIKSQFVKNNLNLKPFFVRWCVFLSVLLILCVSVFYIAKAKTNAIISSSKVSVILSYDPNTLLNDVETRRKFLASRVKGVHFLTYSIKRGDNLWKLAAQYHYSIHTIIGNNPQFTTYDVYEKQKILIPSSGGSLHPIQKDDDWEKIAQRYDIEDAKILKKTNYGIDKLREGEFVFIPGKRPAVDLMNQKMQDAYALRDLFIWPMGGAITSSFGRRRHPVTGQVSVHGGIDMRAAMGTLVGAADDGVVIVASYDVGHYGVAVFIDHNNGYITHYGHLSSILVREGQRVRAGQAIARSGASGRVTGPHLHFTIKRNGQSLNPLRFLW